MEDSLDDIAQGKIIWQQICNECLEHINQLIDNLENNTDGKRIEFTIDKNHSYMIGKHGPVIKCIEGGHISFKPVIQDIDLRKLELGEYKLEDILSNIKNNDILLGKYENEDLFIKTGKFGMYASWGEKTKPLKCFGNRPIENITLIEVIEVLEKEGNIVRTISDTISIRKSKRGDYLFFKTIKMKKPQFYTLKDCIEDYKECDINILVKWVHDKYNIF